MTQRFFRAIMLTIACICGMSAVQAEGFSFSEETTFLRLHTQHGAPVDNLTGFEPGQRFQLGYVNSRNLGTRVTYWEWDHTGEGGGGQLNVKTYNFDSEIFKRIDLTNLTNIEISGGLRYNDYVANIPGATTSAITGFGGLFGVRGAVKTSTGGELYARSKWAVIMGNGADPVFGDTFDVSRNQWELGMGYQHNICLSNGMLLTPRVGAEWITFDGGSPGGLLTANDAVALGGFIFGVGLQY